MNTEEPPTKQEDREHPVFAKVTIPQIVAVAFLGGLFGLITGIFYYARVSVVLIPFAFSGEPELMSILLVAVFAPVGEEIVKVSPVLFVESERKLSFSPLGWMYLGIGSGLGFTIFENVLYVGQFISLYDWRAAGFLVLLRFLLPLHLLVTGIASYGVGAWKQTQERKYISLLLLAMLIHGMHNFLSVVLGV